LARLRNRRFFSLAELNRAIAELLTDFNQRPFKKLPGCRRSAFDSLDDPALRPLPPTRFAISRWKEAKVNIDYHVEFDGHYYSVPHRLVGIKIDVRVTGNLLECFAANQRVAGHALSGVRGHFSTVPDHMTASHRAHLEWPSAKLIAWGQRIGVSTAAVVTWQLEHRQYPEQGYRACLGLLALVRRYTAERLQGACTRAMAIRAPTLRSVTKILKCGLDRQGALFVADSPGAIVHENVRGADYHHHWARARVAVQPIPAPTLARPKPPPQTHEGRPTQAGRMVWIISQVAELKEWIDARLELKMTPNGSVAEFTR